MFLHFFNLLIRLVSVIVFTVLYFMFDCFIVYKLASFLETTLTNGCISRVRFYCESRDLYIIRFSTRPREIVARPVPPTHVRYPHRTICNARPFIFSLSLSLFRSMAITKGCICSILQFYQKCIRDCRHFHHCEAIRC